MDVWMIDQEVIDHMEEAIDLLARSCDAQLLATLLTSEEERGQLVKHYKAIDQILFNAIQRQIKKQKGLKPCKKQ